MQRYQCKWPLHTTSHVNTWVFLLDKTKAHMHMHSALHKTWVVSLEEACAANVRVHNTTVECDSLHCHIWYC